MYYLLIQGFCNYENRIARRFETLSDYLGYCEGEDLDCILNDTKNTNFNINDGVTSKHVFNDDLKPDYLIWFEFDSNNDPVIVSRWFVISYRHLSGKQFEATLRRDLVSDILPNFIDDSSTFIEKGYVENSDPAIFNSEGVFFNRIKKEEKLLIDKSDTSWIIGYLAEDHQALSNINFTITPEVDMIISGDLADWDYYSYVDGDEFITLNPDSNNNKMRFVLHSGFVYEPVEFMFNKNSGQTYDKSLRDRWEVTTYQDLTNYRNSNWLSGINWNTCMSKVLLDHNSWENRSVYENLLSFVGKKISFDDGIYKIELIEDTDFYQDDWNYYNSGNLYDYLYNLVNNAVNGGIVSANYYPVAYLLYLKKFRFRATKITTEQGQYHYSIPQSVRKLNDSPYKMFAIPFKDEYTIFLDDNHYYEINKQLNIEWAVNMVKNLGSNIYDLQILPYCPLSNFEPYEFYDNRGILVNNITLNIDYIELLDSSDHIVSLCFFAQSSSKDFILDYYPKIISTEPKVENECDLYRLCSPNYASVFEFNSAKNGGVEYFTVRFTYKPYQPFINIAPKFNLLYGQDFNDNRGLILSGDFSLPIVTDLWKQYQLQNKNYLLAFDRQIETLETQYSWQRKNAVFNAIGGTFKGGTMGAFAGGQVGGPYGAIAGAVIGTAMSGVGGVMDLTMQEALHRESISYAKDNFRFNIENIMALPNTLNKVSSININSKLFPFLEYYSCTDEEKEAFRNKIYYNGMTVNRFGKIKDYLRRDSLSFIKAKIIILEKRDFHCSANELLELSYELDKGIFIDTNAYDIS